MFENYAKLLFHIDWWVFPCILLILNIDYHEMVKKHKNINTHLDIGQAGFLLFPFPHYSTYI
jgi:hypothetical protein